MTENNYQTKFWLARKFFLKAIEEYRGLNESFFEFAKPLEQLNLDKCKLISTRENLLNYLPKNGVVAEIGVQTGYFSRKILDITLPLKFHAIDIDWSIFEREKFLTEVESGLLQIHQGDSVEILSEYPSEYFDWIYVDADHSYTGVYRDIQCCHTKLKPNGILVFNDYTVWSPLEAHPYGVLKAVNEFCLSQKWEFIFFALSPNGYHDVAIRKISDQELNLLPYVEIDSVANQLNSDIVQLQYDKAQLAYQLKKMQQDIENPESQVQQLQQEVQFWESQYKQNQYDLVQLQSQLQQTQSELERLQSQLQQTQSELERSQSQLQQTQSELERSQSQLQQTQSELEHFRNLVTTIQNSKLWKLRTQLVKIKSFFGITN